MIGDSGGRPAGATSGPGNAGLEGGGPAGPSGGAGGSGNYRNVNVARPDGFVLYFTGMVGEKLIDKLEKRRTHSDAYYGQILKDVPLLQPETAKVAASSRPNRPPPRRTRRRRNTPMSAIAGGPSGGNAGGGNLAQPSSPNDPFGQQGAGSTNPAAAPAKVIDRAMGTGEAQRPDDDLQGTVIPGVMLLGVGRKQQLVDRAKEYGLDALIVISVRVSKTRSGEASSTTNLKIVNLYGEPGEENVFHGKTLKNSATSSDVDKMLRRAFEAADAVFKASDLPPQLKPKHVKKRIETLLADEHTNPLPWAVEILNWDRMDLVEDDQFVIDSLNRLFKRDIGEALLSPDESDRLKALAPWVETSPNDDDL